MEKARPGRDKESCGQDRQFSFWNGGWVVKARRR